MNDTLDTIERITKIQEAQALKREVIADYLDEILHDDGHVFVERSQMGDSDSYVGVVSFRWIDKNMKLFTELPLFRNKIDEKTGNFIIDEETVSELQQRAPHWDRQYPLTVYLLRQKHRKFPPILAVVTQTWVNEPNAPEWDADGRATKSSLVLDPLDKKGRIGLIDFRGGVSAFALDGSHRTIAVRGTMQAVGPLRMLQILNASRKVIKSKPLSELLEEAGMTERDIEGIEDDTIGIELIPAVMKGETREQAKRRIRSIFVHVNKTAAPPTTGEQITLDEDNGYAIITRQVALNHKLFAKDKAGDRINWKSMSLPPQSNWILPATSMADVAEVLLGDTEPYAKWKADKKLIPLRPADEQLEQGAAELTGFFDKVATLPAFAAILRGDKVAEWREFEPDGRGHLLLRPIGMIALADAVGWVHYHPEGPKRSLDEIFAKIKKFDLGGGFENVTKEASYWFGVTYNPVKKRMEMSGRKDGAELLKYLLGGFVAHPKMREETLEMFRQRRSFPDSAYDWDGKKEKDGKKVKTEEIELPPLLTA